MDREEALNVYGAFSIAELKEQLAQRGIPSSGCVEKADLIELLLAADAGQVRVALCTPSSQPVSCRSTRCRAPFWNGHICVCACLASAVA